MTKWISCSGGFIEADVVRWTEAVWKSTRRKGSRPVKTGERIVIAQVARLDDNGWAFFQVIDSVSPKKNRAAG